MGGMFFLRQGTDDYILTDMRRKRRKQSIKANRRKWCKIKENQYFQGVFKA